MNLRRFCLDETTLSSAANLDRLAADLSCLLDLVDRCRRDGQEVVKWSGIYEVQVLAGVPFCELLFNPGRGLDRDLRKLAIVAIDRSVSWDREDEAIDPTVEVAGCARPAHSIAYAHRCIGRGRAVACLCFRVSPLGTGVMEVVAGRAAQQVHFVSGEEELLAFYREVFEIEMLGEADYLRHAPIAFPALFFHPELRFRLPDGQYRGLRPVVTRHLAVLNDHFRQLHGQFSGDAQALSSRLGVDVSPEGPGTHRNAAAMKARVVTVEGREMCCEWHTKLEPHRNRIYFHPGSAAVAGGRLIVGMFHEHLPT